MNGGKEDIKQGMYGNWQNMSSINTKRSIAIWSTIIQSLMGTLGYRQ